MIILTYFILKLITDFILLKVNKVLIYNAILIKTLLKSSFKLVIWDDFVLNFEYYKSRNLITNRRLIFYNLNYFG